MCYIFIFIVMVVIHLSFYLKQFCGKGLFTWCDRLIKLVVLLRGYVMRNGTESVGASSSSSLSSQQDTEDDRMIALVLSEEYANLDGAVARRLSNLAPVPVRCLLFILAHRL